MMIEDLTHQDLQDPWPSRKDSTYMLPFRHYSCFQGGDYGPFRVTSNDPSSANCPLLRYGPVEATFPNPRSGLKGSLEEGLPPSH